jgi:tetratricopeptide (TPR) repeat protein
MNERLANILVKIKRCGFAAALLLFLNGLNAQKFVGDSLGDLLKREKTDTNRVRLLWQLADAINSYNPDTAIVVSKEALYLAKKISDTEGQSRALGILANTFTKVGNYARALELQLQRLQLEEKRNKPGNYASVLINIGNVYLFQEEYRTALQYYGQSDSLITKYHLTELKYYSFLNQGEVYSRLSIPDSAYLYFNKSLEFARLAADEDFIGMSLTGLGRSFFKMGSYGQSLSNYQQAIVYLKKANNNETLCEATLGLAGLYQYLNQPDSAAILAGLSLRISKQGGFLSRQLEAAQFLTNHYKKLKNIDSAFYYLSYVDKLNDSLNSKDRIRRLQIISSNEQFRQVEMAEGKRLEKKERDEQLQLLFIGILIPGLFLITLLLSRVKIHVKVIRVLGVVSLLFFFEYLTLLLHPTVARLTHHTPVLEILIFVAIGAILIPTHHRLEHWLINKLIFHRIHHESMKTPPLPQEPEEAIEKTDESKKHIDLPGQNEPAGTTETKTEQATKLPTQ